MFSVGFLQRSESGFAAATAALALCLAGCDRAAPQDGIARFEVKRAGQTVSLGVFDASGNLVGQPLQAKRVGPGVQSVDLRGLGLPEGDYRWKAVATGPRRLIPLGSAGTGLPRAQGGGGPAIVGGEKGPPGAVAADEAGRVFLGWRMASEGHEVVACDPEGTVLWGYDHGPGASGVWDLAVDGGVVFVLGGKEGADADGGAIYKLDAATGAPIPWEGREGRELPIGALWAQDGTPKPQRAEYLAADNGRLYLTFAKEQFIAVIDAATGAYVITLTAPAPGRMALATTPMTVPGEPERTKVIDFGISVVAGNGLAYFLMEHDPPWVMLSTTRWLPEDDRIAAIALQGDPMRSGDLTIYTALGDPHHQIQRRAVDSAERFQGTIGEQGGRAAVGPWRPDAVRDVRGMAVDAKGRLWVVECDGSFGRFTVWETAGPTGRLLREIVGPLSGSDLSVDPADPTRVAADGLVWRVDPSTRMVACEASGPPPWTSKPLETEWRDADGLVLWRGEPADFGLERKPVAWSFHPVAGRDPIVWARGFGLHAFALEGSEAPRTIAEGRVRIVPSPDGFGGPAATGTPLGAR